MSQNQTATERLAKGTLVYMVGNLLSKVLQMLILPIITYTLNTEEYGDYDLIVTTISLVTPVITLQVIEGMFRFLFDVDDNDRIKTVSTVSALLLAGTLLLGVVIGAIRFVNPYIQYPFLIYINYISAIVFDYMQKLARCQKLNRQFAVSGVLHTITMLSGQAIMLLALKKGVDGMLIANCISYAIPAVYLHFYVRADRWIKREGVNKNTLKQLIRYSAPLVPNSIAWWLVVSSDRYIIAYFIDSAANGIYSVAGKFSQLLTFVVTVFQLAWQESAIIESNSEERDKFYTKTFNTYMSLLLGGYLVVLPVIKLLIPMLLSKDYQTGYLYNPILLIGAIFSAFSQFYGSAYMVFKKTSGALLTTCVAAIINIIIGMGLITKIGLFAPALGTAIAFMVQWLVRAYHLRDCFRIKVDIKKLVVLLLCMVGITLIYYVDSFMLQIGAAFIGIIIFIYVNKRFLMIVIKKVLKK